VSAAGPATAADAVAETPATAMELRLDTDAEREFRHELAGRVTPEQLALLGDGVRRKAETLTALVAVGPEPGRVRDILRLVFATRRAADRIAAEIGAGRLADAIGALIHGVGPAAKRFDEFEAAIGVAAVSETVARALSDLPGELLRFVDAAGQPGRATGGPAASAAARCQLWSRWMWDPATGTGALPLLVDGDLGAGAVSRGEQYERVSRAAALVIGPGPFGGELFLAGVYGIYMHTVLRLRLTPQFGAVVPPVPALIGRLLGAGRG